MTRRIANFTVQWMHFVPTRGFCATNWCNFLGMAPRPTFFPPIFPPSWWVWTVIRLSRVRRSSILIFSTAWRWGFAVFIRLDHDLYFDAFCVVFASKSRVINWLALLFVITAVGRCIRRLISHKKSERGEIRGHTIRSWNTYYSVLVCTPTHCCTSYVKSNCTSFSHWFMGFWKRES